jgi:hypothetical protein
MRSERGTSIQERCPATGTSQAPGPGSQDKAPCLDTGHLERKRGLIAILFFLTLLSSAVAVSYPYLSKLLLDTIQGLLESPDGRGSHAGGKPSAPGFGGGWPGRTGCIPVSGHQGHDQFGIRTYYPGQVFPPHPGQGLQLLLALCLRRHSHAPDR